MTRNPFFRLPEGMPGTITYGAYRAAVLGLGAAYEYAEGETPGAAEAALASDLAAALETLVDAAPYSFVKELAAELAAYPNAGAAPDARIGTNVGGLAARRLQAAATRGAAAEAGR